MSCWKGRMTGVFRIALPLRSITCAAQGRRITTSSPQLEEHAQETGSRYRCEDCDHRALSSVAYHAHRSLHQLRADVTLPDGSSQVITRSRESAHWLCPEHACEYASTQLLSLRAHLRHQRQKRRRQEEANAERAADDADSNVHSSDQVDSSQRNSQSPIPEPSRRVRPRLGVNDTASALRVSLSASPAHVFPRC